MAEMAAVSTKPTAVKKRSTEYDLTTSGMSFVGGRARFHSRFRSYSCFPKGSPRTVVVGIGEKAHITAFRAEFVDNSLDTADPGEARALINYHGHFDSVLDGFQLDAGCVPSELREYWPTLSTANRRRVALALCDGKTPEECFEHIDPEELRKVEVAARVSQKIMCPVSGCMAPPIEGPSAAADIMLHVKIAHPDYDPAR